jgi:nitrogenase molybdenum-iron protein alpha chain
MCLLALIQDAAVVNHAPIGCAADFPSFLRFNEIGQKRRGLPLRSVQLISSNLTEGDIVFGGKEKLTEAVYEAKKRFQPKAIFISTSCASGIIGDDIERIVAEIEDDIGIPLIPIYCEGFKSRIWSSGFDAAYHGILRKIVKPSVKKDPNMVNIINFWGSDIFTPLLERMGLRANYVVPFTTVEQLEHMSDAAATIQMCATLGSYLGTALEEEFGVPLVKSPTPFGSSATDIMLRELGRITGREKEAEALIASEAKRTAPRIAELKKKLAGRTAFIGAGAAHGHGIISIVQELGLKLLGAASWHHDVMLDCQDERTNSLKHVVDTYGDFPFSVCTKQPFTFVNQLLKFKPDVFITRHLGMAVWGAKAGVPTLEVYDEHYGIGYQGLINFGQKIDDVISNPVFVKNIAEHTTLPYTRWWLEQEPYSLSEADN